MRRRRYYYEDDDSLWRAIAGVIFLCLMYLAYLYATNREKFWHWLIYGIIAVGVFFALAILWREIKYRSKQKHFNTLLTNLRHTGQEEYLINFINRFGLEKKSVKGFRVRDYNFAWDRINDLKKIFREKGIFKDEKDFFELLRFYIDEKEEKLTRESIKKEPQKFAILTGTEFEKLLYRLFEKMGYAVEYTGKSGDQGGDLIANKEGERLLIQAKCYRDWSTGNAAVQQVTGAMKYYDCSKAMVITTSYFTPEAIALAKANNTELISKERLQELLLKHLGESWV